MAALVLAYYMVLRSVLRSQPELRGCLTRCQHCRIFFFTHPRNTGRGDLGCPFGCREAHRKEQSNLRSTAYYQDEQGRDKKRALNARRRKGGAGPAAAKVVAPEKSAVEVQSEFPPPWPGPMVDYLCMVVGLIEGRPVSVKEVLEMLWRTVRQHTMVRRRRIDQAVASLHERPP